MKKKILYLAILFTTIGFAQIPTSDIVASYSFENRNTTTDDVNLAQLTQNGTTLQYVRERIDPATSGIPSTANAIQLNGDYLTRSDINANQLTYSFWIRTNTNSTDEKTIIDDSNRTTAGFGANQYGNYVYLQNGKIGLRGRVKYKYPNGNEDRLISSLSTSAVSDGFWHHIVAVIYNQADIRKINTEIWVDGVREDNDFMQGPFSNAAIGRSVTLDINFNTTGNVVIGNNRNEDFPAINRFSEGFDDFLIYSRHLTSTEITQIGTDKGFCYPSSSNALTVAVANENNVTISQNLSVGAVGQNTIKVDLAYHKSSENFSNAIILRNVGRNTTVNNLDINEEYKVYIRQECTVGSNIYNSFSKPVTFETFGNLYVNVAATGTEDGLTWTNAYTNLKTALAIVKKGQNIFVAKGIYKPAITADRDSTFFINKSYVSIYGGFAGYETNINQRIIGTNETILSGDLLGNDGNTTSFTSFTHGDNSKNIITLGNNIEFTVLDGLTISGGYNPNTVGAAVVLNTNNDFFTMNQCIIENNLALGGAGFLRLYNSASSVESSLSQKINITKTIFRKNVATYASSVYMANLTNRNGTILETNITNCLFYGNISQDNGTNAQGFLGSSLWIRNLKPNVDYITNVSNSIFTNNSDIATRYNNVAVSTISLSNNGSTGSTHIANLTNNIHWKNIVVGNITARSIVGGPDGLGAVNIKNSIAEDSFPNINSTNGTKMNVLNSDPLFTDEANKDYTLTSGSPAIDSGFNTTEANMPNAIDLLGNFRIFNTNVDIGAYEFGAASATVTRTLTLNSVNGTVVANPLPTNGVYPDGTVVTLTATPNTGFGFANWSNDLSGVTNPITITMDADKTATANFSATASVKEENKIDVSVYPNPIKNFMTLQLNEEIKTGLIIDVTGKEIKKFTENKINIKKLSSGMYFVKIKTNSGKIAIKKIIKK